MPVLICLANPNAASAVIDYLRIHGLDTERADDAELARRLLRFRSYDALICDSDGPTLARIAKRRHAHTRTVVLSTERPRKAGDASIDFELVKPLPLSVILGCLSPTA